MQDAGFACPDDPPRPPTRWPTPRAITKPGHGQLPLLPRGPTIHADYTTGTTTQGTAQSRPTSSATRTAIQHPAGRSGPGPRPLGRGPGDRRPGPDFLSRLALSSDRKSTRLNSSHSQISYAVF